jgi:asparagine synthase (glutamine-hydrolysing)
MCGICGIYNFDSKEVSQDILHRMNETMILRGPDDSGYFVEKNVGVAMRRLSIVDIKTGQQPISNENDTIKVVMNGEIYNYVELHEALVKKGHQFKTRSDTEVLVHLYEEYGTDAVKHLNGMFAFALWDSSRNRLWVVRDRLGIKPLVYFESQNGFVFASTLDSLACHPDFKKDVDNDSLLLYFMLAYIPTPRTIWKQSNKLPAGHWLLVEDNQVKTEQYWSPKPQIQSGRTREDFVREIQESFNNSIEIHSRSDVPVGTFLSGGVDSSAITAEFCLRSKKSVNTFTMDFEGKDINEGNYAQLVSHKYNTEHHFQTLSLDSALENLQELLPLIDEPLADSAIIPSYILSKLARDQNMKVILGGAGGDELFGGYQRHYPSFRDKLSGSLPYIPLHFWNFISRIATPKIAHYGGLTWDKGVSFAQSTSGVHFGFFERLLRNPKDFSKAMTLTRKQFSSLSDNENDLGFSYDRMLVDVQNYLVDNVLAVTDKTSMAASVEARVPLLDHRLVELAFSVPEIINIGRDFHDSKVSFKKAIKSNLPHEILNRPKVGFNGPVYEWINKKHPKFEDRILKPRHPSIQSMFDHDSIKKTWLSDSNRVTACETFFMIYVADMWLENHA